jgi:S1-C subfamily serine protease
VVNGKTIGSTEQFIASVDQYQPGQTVTMTVKRGGQSKTISLKLGVRPAASPSGG